LYQAIALAMIFSPILKHV